MSVKELAGRPREIPTNSNRALESEVNGVGVVSGVNETVMKFVI